MEEAAELGYWDGNERAAPLAESRLPDSEIFYDFNYGYADPEVICEGLEQDFERELKASKHLYEEDKVWIREVLSIAKVLHEGRYRRELNLPEIVHPLEVALEALRRNESSTMICAALLHDAIEDTDLGKEDTDTFQGLVKSGLVPRLVEFVSKYRYQTELTPEEYRAQLASDRLAVRLKLYDRVVNLRSFGRMVMTEPYRVWKQIKETREEILPLAQEFYGLSLYPELRQLVDQLEHRLHAAYDIMLENIEFVAANDDEAAMHQELELVRSRRIEEAASEDILAAEVWKVAQRVEGVVAA